MDGPELRKLIMDKWRYPLDTRCLHLRLSVSPVVPLPLHASLCLWLCIRFPSHCSSSSPTVSVSVSACLPVSFFPSNYPSNVVRAESTAAEMGLGR